MHDQHDNVQHNNMQPKAGRGSALYWIVLLLVGVLAAVIYLLYVGFGTMADSAARTVATVETVAEKFRQGTIENTFRQAIPEIFPLGSGRLEVAELSGEISLSKQDELRLFWDQLPLGTTRSEMKVTAHYRYHVPMDEPWSIEVEGHSCIVYAPRLMPTLPPGLDLNTLEWETKRGWMRFNTDEVKDALRQDMGQHMQSAAYRNLSLVREPARQVIAEFIRQWLLREDHWRADRFSSVQVVFADEDRQALRKLSPVLELGHEDALTLLPGETVGEQWGEGL